MKIYYSYFSNLVLTTVLGTGLILTGCSSSSSTDEDTNAEGTNALEAAYPSGLAIASPFAVDDAADASFSALIKSAEGDEEEEGEDEPLTYEEKQAAIDGILNATSLEDCFDYDTTLTRGEPEVECYGPNLTLSGTHPDGAMTDNPATPDVDETGTFGLPGGDLGIWLENEDDEACIAAKVNSEFYGIEGKIDFAMLTMASAICVANNSGMALPAAEETLDLSEAMASAIEAFEAADEAEGEIEDTEGEDDVEDDESEGEAPIEPTSISLSREADTADGHPVYVLTLVGSIDNDDDSTTPVTMTLRHIPVSEDDNSTYQGLLQYTALTDDIPTFNCGGSGSHTLAGSALYQKASASDLRVRYRQAVFCGEATEDDIFNDDGEADEQNKKSGCPSGGGTANGWGDDFTEVVVNIDPSTGLGSMAYAWQAGRCDMQTRAFNAAITADGGTSGAEGGCGYFGYGPDMTDEDAGTIDGMICNWAGPGSEAFGSKTVNTLVQRQCVTRNETTGKFDSVSDDLNIAYAPTLDCDSDGTLLCDGVACATTNDLLSESQMSFTAPNEPDAL